MFFQNPLEKKFRQWGKGRQFLPGNAAEMKEKIVTTAKLNAQAATKVYPSRFCFKFLSFGLAGFLIFIGAQAYLDSKYSIDRSFALFPVTSQGSAERADAPTANTVYNYDGGINPSDLAREENAKIMNAQDAQMYGATGIAPTEPRVAPEIYPYPPVNTTPAADSREFLKMSYSANVQTRDAEETTTRILAIVRGHGGRIDSANINEAYGYVSFVVPKDELLTFKNEVKTLVGKKFYSENLNLQNLLPEKVAIEDSTNNYKKLFSDSQDKLNDLNAKHAKTIADLQRNLSSVKGQIAKLKAEVTTDPERQKQIKAEISSLYVRQAAIQRQISDENTWYGWDKTRLEGDVKNFQAELENLAKQDKNLQDNVEMVQGSVSVQWISFWEMLDIYVPYFWAWMVGVVVAGLVLRSLMKKRSIEAW